MSVLQLRGGPGGSGVVRAGPGRAAAAREQRPRPAGTTRWSPPGTGWPSRRSPRPGAARPARVHRGRRRTPPSCWPSVHLTARAGCCVLRGTGGRGRTRACWRTTPASPRGCSRCPGSPVTPGGSSWPGAAGDRAGPVRRRRDGGVLRHRRRRRAADLPAGGPGRQRRALRDVAAAGALLSYVGADRVGPAPRRRRRGARRRARAGARGSRAPPAGAWPWPRPGCPARPRSRSSGRPMTAAPQPAPGRAARRPAGRGDRARQWWRKWSRHSTAAGRP